jgi:hypothetical protein
VWGTEEYSGRPTLALLLSAPIVAMWVEQKLPRRGGDDCFRLKAYATAAEVHEDISSIVLLGKQLMLVGHRLAKLFVEQKPVRIVGVKLIAGIEDLPQNSPNSNKN